ARLEPGFALFTRYARLEERLKNVQLVVTGEGAIDKSTLMGKGVGELARLCKQAGVPCLGIGGLVADPSQAKQLFSATYALTPDFTSASEAMSHPAHWLEIGAASAAS